jgi:hypothetical protein
MLCEIGERGRLAREIVKQAGTLAVTIQLKAGRAAVNSAASASFAVLRR